MGNAGSHVAKRAVKVYGKCKAVIEVDDGSRKTPCESDSL